MVFKYELGIRAKDIVTGFEGIIVARVEYFNGCMQYCLKPKMKTDGSCPEGEYFDEQYLSIVDDGIKSKKNKKNMISPSGGDIMADCPKE